MSHAMPCTHPSRHTPTPPHKPTLGAPLPPQAGSVMLNCTPAAKVALGAARNAACLLHHIMRLHSLVPVVGDLRGGGGVAVV